MFLRFPDLKRNDVDPRSWKWLTNIGIPTFNPPGPRLSESITGAGPSKISVPILSTQKKNSSEKNYLEVVIF